MDPHALVLNDDLMLEELGQVRRIVQRLLCDPNDADDVVQEAWLRTRTAPVRFESRGRLRAWLVAVAHRMARDTLRARNRRAAREKRAARLEALADAADVVERSALLERLLKAVRALEEPQRSTVLLRYLDGHSTAEIAAAMSVSEEVVRKRLARTCAHLRATLALGNEARQGGRVPRIASCALWLALLVAIQGLGQAPRPAGQAGHLMAGAELAASRTPTAAQAESSRSIPEPRADEHTPDGAPDGSAPDGSTPDGSGTVEPASATVADASTTVAGTPVGGDDGGKPLILSVGE